MINCLKSTGIDNFTTGWSELFKGKSEFKTFTHQQWVEWVRYNDSRELWADWLEYINKRYKL